MTTEDLVKGGVAPIVSTVDATVEETLAFGVLTAGPLTELAFGLIVLVLIIVLHGWSMGRISRMFARRVVRLPDNAPSWRINILLAITIGLMALTHLTETLLWAAPIYVSGLIPDFRDSYFFVLETYTTLGDANIALPEAWRLIGPLIAISGLFTFSWTGSVLVYVVGEIGRRHSLSEAVNTRGASPPPQDGGDRAG